MDQAEFIRIFTPRPQNFAWLLGAGASRNAGLPSADDVIDDLKRRYYCSEENQLLSSKDMQNDAVRERVESFMTGRGFPSRWAPSEYSTYFEKFFGEDRERQRSYLSAMLAEDRVSLAIGNRVFGALLAAGLTRIAFTTNFDTVVEKAMAEVAGRSLSAYHLEGSAKANDALNNEEFPLYCKLHGDFRYDSLKNLSADLAEQNENLSRALVNAANRSGLIVAGYSGRDDSVMRLLESALDEQNPYPHGLYWTGIKGADRPDVIETLLTKVRARGIEAEYVEVETFDTLMLRLWRNLPEKPEELDRMVRRDRARKVAIPILESTVGKPILRLNGLPILAQPDQCLALGFSKRKTWEDIKSVLHGSENNLILTVDDTPLIWGREEEAQQVFGPELQSIKPRSIDLDWTDSGRLHVKRFYEDGIAKALSRTRPLLSRRRRSRLFMITDKMATDIGAFEDLHQVTGKVTGVIPGLSVEETEDHPAATTVAWAEAARISLSRAHGQTWLLISPDVWIWPAFARPYARKFLDSRRGGRRNDKHDALLTAWRGILLDTDDSNASVSLTAFDGDPGPGNPVFTLSALTSYSWKRGGA